MHARKSGNTTYTFLVSGKLWRNSLIMQDKETGSLWSHVTGEALHGEAKGARLEIFPSVQTTWKSWVAEHPDTLVLEKSESVSGSAYAKYFADPDRVGILPLRKKITRLPAKAMVYGIERDGAALAVTESGLAPGQPLMVKLGGESLVVARGEDGGARAFVAGDELVFVRRGGRIVDEESGSAWDLGRGVATAGSRRGQQLVELPVRPAFWFAWLSFYPQTEVAP